MSQSQDESKIIKIETGSYSDLIDFYETLLGRIPTKNEIALFQRIRQNMKLTDEASCSFLLHLTNQSSQQRFFHTISSLVTQRRAYEAQETRKSISELKHSLDNFVLLNVKKPLLLFAGLGGIFFLLVFFYIFNKSDSQAAFYIPVLNQEALKTCFNGQGQVVIKNGHKYCLPTDSDGNVFVWLVQE